MQHQEGKQPGKGDGAAQGTASSLPPWACLSLRSAPDLLRVASLHAVGWTGLAGTLAKLADAEKDRVEENRATAAALSAGAVSLSQRHKFASAAAPLAVAVDAASR